MSNSNGWNETTGQTDHTALKRYVKQLRDPGYVARDATESARLDPHGSKAGYYLDLVNYIGMQQSGNLR